MNDASVVKPNEQATVGSDKGKASQPTARDASFDIVKGIGIIEVMAHHLLSHSARKYTREGAWDWWAMMLAHKIFHFAVPAFLLITAVLLARSLQRFERPDWKRFYRRRVQRSLLPYAMWTLIYLLFRLRFAHNDAEVRPTPVNMPGGITANVPFLLTDGAFWRSALLWGKMWYHLYFLSVLLQFSLLFGFLFSVMRRLNLSFGRVLLTSALLQGAAFWLNANLLYPAFGFNTPASSVLWYLPPFLIGTWIGLRFDQWERAWQHWRLVVVALAAIGLTVYLWLDLAQMRGANVNSYAYNGGLSAYTTAVALLLLRVGQRLAGGAKAGAILQRIGNWSLPLFLVHPMALYFLSGPRLNAVWVRFPFPFVLLGLAMFAVSWSVAWLLMKARLDTLLFGRLLSTPSGNAS